MGHEDHIKRHLDGMKSSYPPERIAQLVDACGFDPETLEDASDQQCEIYLEAVGTVISKMAYHFAAANFIFAGCSVATSARTE